MNLNKCLKTMEYLHATLHFAVLIPLVYAVAELSDPAGRLRQKIILMSYFI